MQLWHELPFEARCIQLLDNDLKIAATGNTVSAGYIQIIGSEGGNVTTMGAALFPGGKVFDFEVCEKTLCAISYFDTGEKISDIKFFDCRTVKEMKDVALKNCKQSNVLYNSLSFCAENNNLAATTESGSVNIWNLSTLESLVAFTADLSGVRKVDYFSGNLLSTVGCSANGQLRIWDLRQRRSAIQLIEPKSEHYYSHPRISGTKVPSYTCTSNFDSQVLCGTSDGQLVEWDIKYPSAPVRSTKIHDDLVTSVKFYPGDDNSSVISSSRSGTEAVKKTFLEDPFETKPEDCLLQDPEEAIVSLAVSRSSIFAVSSAGGVWQMESY